MTQDKKSEIYRSAALERLATLDKLDTLVRVIPSKSWFALAGLGLLIGAGLAWGWYGSIPTTVTSEGIIVRRAGLEIISGEATGRITKFNLEIGDQVEVGDRIAEVEQPDLEVKLLNAKARLVEFQERRRTMIEMIGRLNDYSEKSEALREKAFKNELQAAYEASEINRELVQARKHLLDKGEVTRLAYVQMYRDYTASIQKIASIEGKIAELEVEHHSRKHRDAQEIAELTLNVANTQREIEVLQRSIEHNSILRSPFAGRIVEVTKGVGDLVNAGQQIAKIELRSDETDDLHVLSFPSANAGKKIRRGMEARVIPSTVKREESGYLIGQVEFVSDYTVARPTMVRELQSEALVDKLLETGPPLEIRTILHKRPDGTKLRWSATTGSQPEIESGTLAKIEVVTHRQRPLSLVIPLLKRFSGLE